MRCRTSTCRRISVDQAVTATTSDLRRRPRGLATNEFNIAENITPRPSLSTRRWTRCASAERPTAAPSQLQRPHDRDEQIVRDASAYYLLGYSSVAAPTDGKFHEIKVRIRKPGVQVRSRKGYWAVSPADVDRMTKVATAAPVPKPVQNALATLAYPTRMRIIRTWVGAERGENGKTRRRSCGKRTGRAGPATDTGRPARVLVAAVGADGSPFPGRIPTSIPSA
jgi:hypothetical protein